MAIEQVLQTALNDAIQEIGATKNIKNVTELTQALNSGVTSQVSDALSIYGDLIAKCVQQEVSSIYIHSKYDKWKLFEGAKLVGGNKSYVKTFTNSGVFDDMTGTAQYLPSTPTANGQFDPNKVTRFDPPLVEQVIGDLIKKQTSITNSPIMMIQGVISVAKIMEIISSTVKNLYNAYNLYMYNVVFTDICSYFNHKLNEYKQDDTLNQGVYEDKLSQSNFQCAQVLALLCKEMSDVTNKFNIDNTYKTVAHIKDSTNPFDMLVLYNPKVLIKLEMGTKSGVFNKENVKFLADIPKENWIELPLNKYNNVFDNTKQPKDYYPTETPTPYLDEKTIIIMSKKAFAVLPVNFKVGTQYWSNDDTQFNTLHFWFHKDIIKFEKALVYHAENLSKSLDEANLESE